MRKRSADRSRRDFLVSIHPRFVETIFSGRKTVELRRRFSDSVEANSLVFIYGTSPMQCLIGTARIVDVKRLPKAHIWRQFGKQACVSKAEFEAYFSGVDFGYAILLDRSLASARPSVPMIYAGNSASSPRNHSGMLLSARR